MLGELCFPSTVTFVGNPLIYLNKNLLIFFIIILLWLHFWTAMAQQVDLCLSSETLQVWESGRLWYVLVVDPWESRLNTLKLRFLICEMERGQRTRRNVRAAVFDCSACFAILSVIIIAIIASLSLENTFLLRVCPDHPPPTI